MAKHDFLYMCTYHYFFRIVLVNEIAISMAMDIIEDFYMCTA